MMRNKTGYVADGCMTFIDSLISQHHADGLEVYEQLLVLIKSKTTLLKSLDPNRNR